MKGRDDLSAFVRLIRLQELAALSHQEEFATARVGTDESSREVRQAEGELKAASAQVEAIFARATLCIDRLAIAANELTLCHSRVGAAAAALDDAQIREEASRTAYLKAEKRLEWTEQQVRQLRKKYLSKREDAALREAIGLHVVKAMAR
jgi:hypothetical protein